MLIVPLAPSGSEFFKQPGRFPNDWIQDWIVPKPINTWELTWDKSQTPITICNSTVDVADHFGYQRNMYNTLQAVPVTGIEDDVVVTLRSIFSQECYIFFQSDCVEATCSRHGSCFWSLGRLWSELQKYLLGRLWNFWMLTALESSNSSSHGIFSTPRLQQKNVHALEKNVTLLGKSCHHVINSSDLSNIHRKESSAGRHIPTHGTDKNLEDRNCH